MKQETLLSVYKEILNYAPAKSEIEIHTKSNDEIKCEREKFLKISTISGVFSVLTKYQWEKTYTRKVIDVEDIEYISFPVE